MTEPTQLAVVRPTEWTLRLESPPDAALAVLGTVAQGDIRVTAIAGSTVELTIAGREPVPRVLAEVVAREVGSEVRVRLADARSTTQGVVASLMAGACVVFGVNMAATHALGYLVAGLGVWALLRLLSWRVEAERGRHRDFAAIAQAIDTSLAALKPGAEGQVYRVGAAGEVEPASEPRRRRRR